MYEEPAQIPRDDPADIARDHDVDRGVSTHYKDKPQGKILDWAAECGLQIKEESRDNEYPDDVPLLGPEELYLELIQYDRYPPQVHYETARVKHAFFSKISVHIDSDHPLEKRI